MPILLLWSEDLRIIGIDPGYAIVGYSVLDFENGKRILVECGTIETSQKSRFEIRLGQIFDKLNSILKEFKPDCASVENLFFQNNQKTAINVAHARGIILLSLMKHNVKIFEFTPLQAKSAITGFGKATKEQMILMTQRILNLSEPIKPDDAADACALALTLSLVGKGIDIGSKIKKF